MNRKKYKKLKKWIKERNIKGKKETQKQIEKNIQLIKQKQTRKTIPIFLDNREQIHAYVYVNVIFANPLVASKFISG